MTTSYNKFYHPEENSGICVIKRDDENYEDLLKRFRKKFSKSGIIKDLRDKSYYEKPSDKKRRKRAQSIRAREKEVEKEQEQMKRYKTKKNLKDPKGDWEND